MITVTIVKKNLENSGGNIAGGNFPGLIHQGGV